MKGRKRIIALLSAVLLLAGLVTGAGAFPYWCEECGETTEFCLRDESPSYTGDKVCTVCGWMAEKGEVINLEEETQPEDPPTGNGEQPEETEKPSEETEKPQESTEPGEPQPTETNLPEEEKPNQLPEENVPENASGQEEPIVVPPEGPQQMPEEKPVKPAEEAEALPELPAGPIAEPEAPAAPETLPAETETLPPEPAEAPAETLPPAIPDSPAETAPIVTEEETRPASDEAPAEPAAENPAPAQNNGKKEEKIPETRDLERYPVFSEKYPERRLNAPGDPDAWAEFAGK